MEPHRFGRKLGIGVRVASRMAKERAAQAAASGSSSSASANGAATAQSSATGSSRSGSSRSATSASAAATPQTARPATRKSYTEPARRVGVGTRRFGQAIVGPLAHIGSTLWLEITGLFFALFAVFFAQNAFRLRASALHGADHAHFLAYAAITVLFLYFSASSFLRAALRSRKARR